MDFAAIQVLRRFQLQDFSTVVARAGVVVRPAVAKGRDPCRLRRRHRSSRVVNVQHLQRALLNSRSLSWQRPTTRDKLYDLISYVRKLKINIACISEMKNFNPEGEAISFVFIEECMFILAESTGIILDPISRIAFQNGGSVVRTGSERSILIKLQFPTGNLAVGATYFPTGVAAAMRDLELVNVLSLIHLAKSWKMPLYLGGDRNGHIGNDHGGDDIHIGPFYFIDANYSQRIRLRAHFCKRTFIFERQLSLTGQKRNMETQQWELV